MWSTSRQLTSGALPKDLKFLLLPMYAARIDSKHRGVVVINNDISESNSM
jgi:hypothetical protein